MRARAKRCWLQLIDQLLKEIRHGDEEAFFQEVQQQA